MGDPTFFATPALWRRWLARHHARRQELWVGYYKKDSGIPGITWPESVDQALCFGWIDGVRHRIDDQRYKIRFTPRRPTSTWSAVNLRRMEALVQEGQVHPAGLAAFENRRGARTGLYSYEQVKSPRLTPEFRTRLRNRAKSWVFWQSQPPGYRRTATFWVMSAKREATRKRRMATLIKDSAAGQRVAPLRRP